MMAMATCRGSAVIAKLAAPQDTPASTAAILPKADVASLPCVQTEQAVSPAACLPPQPHSAASLTSSGRASPLSPCFGDSTSTDSGSVSSTDIEGQGTFSDHAATPEGSADVSTVAGTKRKARRLSKEDQRRLVELLGCTYTTEVDTGEGNCHDDEQRFAEAAADLDLPVVQLKKWVGLVRVVVWRHPLWGRWSSGWAPIFFGMAVMAVGSCGDGWGEGEGDIPSLSSSFKYVLL